MFIIFLPDLTRGDGCWGNFDRIPSCNVAEVTVAEQADACSQTNVPEQDPVENAVAIDAHMRTTPNRKSQILSLGLTTSTRQSNSRLKSLKIIQHFWILPSTKATDLQRNQSLTFALYSCHPPGVVKGFIKGETLRLLRTNSSKATFEENVARFKLNIKSRGYPGHIIKKTISSVPFKDRQSALQPKPKANKQTCVSLHNTIHRFLT